MTNAPRPPVDAPKRTLSAELLHHLRTPLNQIIGYSEMLTEQAQEEGQTGFLPDLHRIHKAGRQLLALLNTGVPTLTEETQRAGSPDLALSGDTPPPEAKKGTLVEPLTPTDASQALILIVDDNSANRDMLSRRLERQGHRVAMAANGREAMEAVETQAFDLVLLDVMMPEMDGYTVLQRLKADEALRQIPVIMISALEEMESVVRCIQMGAEDYLPKPFDPTLLKARISACLEKKRASDREIHLYRQLQQSYVRLQELGKMRDDLTHMIIHDLRTPLTSVILGMQTLEVTGELNEDQQEMRDIALQGGETLLGMINDLLDISKMESGSMPLDETTLSASELVADAVN
jgi:two-component system sensor histidine kinase/response regulator